MVLTSAPSCQQIFANGPDRFYYIDTRHGLTRLPADAMTGEAYLRWTDALLACTDIGQFHRLGTSPLAVIEGSFLTDRIAIHGSIHIVTDRLTRSWPAVTVRKQPSEKITLAQMEGQAMLSGQMRELLEAAVLGRLNLLVSGGSGAGKTTLARALSLLIPSEQRIVTAEEIDELAVGGHLPNSVSMTTWRSFDELGVTRVEVTLEQLVREALRMRPDRIWVGETRGQEAYALVKACNSGHDGSLTTVHGDNGQQAVKQLVSYVTESHLSEITALDQVARAFHLVVQISKPDPQTRFITEITELEPVREGTEQRRNPLFLRNPVTGSFDQVGVPSTRLCDLAARYGVKLPSRPQAAPPSSPDWA